MKFKVWCKNKKEWETDSVMLAPDGRLMHHNGYGSCTKCNPETHIAVFSTSLKDRNNKEIFEGDIVEWDDSMQSTFTYKAEVRVQKLGGKIHSTPFINMTTRVIGNIHENPELLDTENEE